MPTYLYSCEQCKQEFEEYHSMSHVLEECPKCKANGKESPPPKRLISGTSFILVGGGWASEGYK
jgi:putative FmdB family regulatory protein